MAEHGAPARPTVVFLRPQAHPYANASLPAALSAAGFDVRIVDVVTRLRRRRLRMARAAVAAVVAYGPSLLRGRHSPKAAVLRTPTAARLLRTTALEAVRELDIDAPFVTLQIQSLFDGHVPGVPHFLYTDHTHLANLGYEHFDRRSLYSPAWIECERGFYRAAQLCFVRSRHVARSLVDDYGIPADAVEVVHAGPNADTASVAADPASSTDVVFVGVDWVRKGGPELVEAMALVRAGMPDASVTVVGCTPQDAGDARVVGRVPLDDVPRHLAAAGVFCLPTRVEPFGVAIVEAMRAGLPVVATSVGAVPDMVEDGGNGLLVPPGDVPALAEALRTLMSDPDLRRRLGRRSAEIAARRFTWESVVDRLEPHLMRASGLPAEAAP